MQNEGHFYGEGWRNKSKVVRRRRRNGI